MRSLTLFLVASALVGCSDDSPRVAVADAAVDAATSDRTIDASTSALDASHVDAVVVRDDASVACPQTWEDCVDAPLPRFRTLLRASSFGESARFVAMSGHLVLVDDGQQSTVLRMQPDQEDADGGIAAFPLPAGQRGRDLAGGRYVLVCAADDSCALWALDDTLAPVETHGLPSGVTVDGIAWFGGLQDTSSGPCVYGSAVSCFHDDAWTPALAGLAGDDRVVAASVGRVVTQHGRWFQRAFDESTGAEASSYDELSPLSADAGVLHGNEDDCAWTDQEFWCAYRTQRNHCAVTDGVRAAFAWDLGLGALTGKGDLLLGNFDQPWCRIQSGVQLTGETIDVAHEYCGSQTSFRVLTANELVGESYCRSFL